MVTLIMEIPTPSKKNVPIIPNEPVQSHDMKNRPLSSCSKVRH